MTVPNSPATSSRTRPRVRIGQALLTLLLTICGLVAVSTAFSDDPFPGPAVVLIASFGLLAAVLGIAVVWWGGRAGAALWALPLFFVVHVAVLGTWLPDAVFAVTAAVALLLARAGAGRRA